MSINRFFIQYFSLTIRFRTVGPQLSSSNIQSRRGKNGGTISRDGSQRISYDSERQMKPWLELGIGALHTISKKRVVMNNIRVKIKNLRAVKSFDFEFPLTRGVNLICGSNGTGKSTIMSVFAKVVYPNALNKYFRNDGCDDTEVIYHYNGNSITWIKNSNGSWSIKGDAVKPVCIDGFFEGSFIYGNRFSDAHKSRINKILKIKDKDYVDADPFVIKWMGNILQDDDYYYHGLKRTSDDFDVTPLHLSRHCYAWFSDAGVVNQFMMSSGEYLILVLLDYLKSRLDELSKRRRGGVKSTTLIILDEADMALHPSSQERLMDFLYSLCDEYSDITDICVYISTHSTAIIMKESKDNIFLLDNNNGDISVVKECFPGYAMRDVSNGVYFDKLILVEDVLAKAYVEHVIKKRLAHKNVLYQVIFIGGYKEVINFHRQAEVLRLGGARKIISILEGDGRQEVIAYKRNNKIYVSCCFLPILSIEKFIYEEIINKNNRELRNLIENSFFRVKGLRQIIADYKRNLKPDSDEKELKKGKVFWACLLTEVVQQGGTVPLFIDHVCNLAV